MPDREDRLRDSTFKGQMETLEQRIYSTLTLGEQNKQISQNLWMHRMTKAITCLVRELNIKGVLDDEAIDDWLLTIVR
jgi:hypothetical protein